MAIRMAGTIAHLEGDWTVSGVDENIAAMLVSLNRIEAEGEKSFQINCGRLDDADPSCLQLLKVWVECSRLRGIDAQLINVNTGMLRSINEAGCSQLFFETYSDMPC